MKNLTLMRWTAEEQALIKRIKPLAIMSGLAWSFSATLAAGILMYAWVVLSASPVYYLGALVIAGTAAGALAGGVAAGLAARTLGLMHGFLAGLCYALMLLALFMLGSGAGFSTVELTVRVLFLGITGALGGLLGINIPYMMKKRPARKARKKFLQKELLFPRRS